MYRIPSTLSSDLDYTESLVKKYKAGEITAGELKANRVPIIIITCCESVVRED